jgi:hypothetical protein
MGDLTNGKVQGYIPTKSAIHIPCRFPRINHEIAHIVEVKDFTRLTKIDWGMRIFGRARRTDPLYVASDNGFFAGMAREIRVKAIERRMNDSDAYSAFLSAGWLYDAERRLPFGKFDTFKDLSVWMMTLSERAFNDWNKDRIRFEWEKRLHYLQDWMETP